MPSGNLRDAFPAFTTTCALITTDGPHGPNVMAAEWTFNVSYRPFLILVAIDPGNRTHDMILESQEFGVNLVAEDQVAAMGFAGHYSKADTDKLSSEAFDTFPAKHIRAPLIRGALLAAGIVLFCGSLYALALSSERWLGAVTPLGGLAFLAGWACLAGAFLAA